MLLSFALVSALILIRSSARPMLKQELPPPEEIERYTKFAMGFAVGSITEMASYDPNNVCLADMSTVISDLFMLSYIYQDYLERVDQGETINDEMLMLDIFPYAYSITVRAAEFECGKYSGNTTYKNST